MKSANSFCKIKAESRSKILFHSIFCFVYISMFKIDAKMIPKSQNHHFCNTIGKLTLRTKVSFWKLVWYNYLNMQNFSALVVWEKIFFVWGLNPQPFKWKIFGLFLALNLEIFAFLEYWEIIEQLLVWRLWKIRALS